MNFAIKRKMTCVALASAFGMALSLPAFADTSGSSGASVQTQRATQASKDTSQAGRDVRASKLIGRNVENAQGDNLGEVKDLIIDTANQRVHYAVLSFGGMLGLGDKLFAYPVSAFKPQVDGDKLVLNVDKDKLKNAPGFDKDKWPDWSDNRYRSSVDKYFKTGNAKDTGHPVRMVRASQLIDKDVNDRNGKDVGEIEDLVVNMSTGKIPFVVLDFDKAWSPDDKLLPLPLTALNFPSKKSKDIVLNLDRNQLDMARGFDDDHWPDLNSAEFRNNMKAHLAAIGKPARTSGGATEKTTSSGNR